MTRRVMQLGYILILFSLLTGFAVPRLSNPRLGLAAHTVGVLGGLLLIIVGATDSAFVLTDRARRTMHASWVFATYANWAASLLGGLTGASRFTPIAGQGTTAGPLAEMLVASMLALLAVAAIVGAVLSIRGLSGVSAHQRR